MTQTATTTLERTVVETQTSDDAGKSAHIIMVPPHLRGKVSPQAHLTEARIEGKPVTAICGHTWVPSRDPKQLPLCSRCKDIYENDPNGFGDRGDLPDE